MVPSPIREIQIEFILLHLPGFPQTGPNTMVEREEMANRINRW